MKLWKAVLWIATLAFIAWVVSLEPIGILGAAGFMAVFWGPICLIVYGPPSFASLRFTSWDDRVEPRRKKQPTYGWFEHTLVVVACLLSGDTNAKDSWD
jgi:hypothetical protein